MDVLQAHGQQLASEVLVAFLVPTRAPRLARGTCDVHVDSRSRLQVTFRHVREHGAALSRCATTVDEIVQQALVLPDLRGEQRLPFIVVPEYNMSAECSEPRPEKSLPTVKTSGGATLPGIDTAPFNANALPKLSRPTVHA